MKNMDKKVDDIVKGFEKFVHFHNKVEEFKEITKQKNLKLKQEREEKRKERLRKFFSDPNWHKCAP